MYTLLARLCGYTSLAAIVIIGTANLNISFAGGDPNVKDKKAYQTKSNIKQHDHSSTYKTQNKKQDIKKSKNTTNSKSTQRMKNQQCLDFLQLKMSL